MPRKAITFDTVCDIGLALPDVERTTAWRSPALKVLGKLMAVVPTHKSAEPDSLVVCVPFEQRDELIAAEPDVYYTPYRWTNRDGARTAAAHPHRRTAGSHPDVVAVCRQQASQDDNHTTQESKLAQVVEAPAEAGHWKQIT